MVGGANNGQGKAQLASTGKKPKQKLNGQLAIVDEGEEFDYDAS